MLCDGFSQSILGQRLVKEGLCFAGEMPFFMDLHTAFRRWNADPIKTWGNHPGLAIPYIVEIDELRSRIITRVVSSFAPVPTSHIPRKTPAKNRSEEHTSELQSLMRISYAVFCLNKKTQ